MKKTNCLILFLILLINIQCSEKEYIDVDVNPQLEIIVINTEGNVVLGTTVKLFQSEEDLISKLGELQIKTSDSEGKVVFEDLEEKNYYFYAEKGDLNNYFEVVTFSEPLVKNELKSITCIIK
jgi:hypothetical protein